MTDSRFDFEIVIEPEESEVRSRLEDTLTAYEKVAKEIEKAFSQVDFSDAITDTVKLRRYSENLSGQISYLRMNLGSLKTALTEAFAPIGNVILPVINRIISRLTSFIHTLAAVFAAVSQVITGTDSVTQSNEDAADSYESMGSAAKRSLAGFDQIERLNDSSGSGGVSTSQYDPTTTLTGDMQEMANKILQFLQPLLAINLEPLRAALSNLWATAQPFLQQLGQLLSYLWQAVVVPCISWCVQTLLPVLTGLATTVLENLTAATEPLITGVKLVWDALQPVVEYIRSAVISCLLSWRQVFQELTTQLEEKGPAIATVFHGIRTVIQTVWNAISPVLQALRDQFSSTFSGIGQVAMQVFGAILDGLAGLTEFLAGVFTSDWKRAWNGLLLFLKGIVNTLIGLLNSMLVMLTNALNGVVRLVNKLKYTVPSWVPGLGGKTFSINLPTFQAPQIPYLAKGAVLPANKPFLAMVGDQRHGTNVEAPLATIQQAVAAVMDDYTQANMTGHNATVSVLGQILEAVLGIEIGDEVIARAASRYNTKMAIVRGG